MEKVSIPSCAVRNTIKNGKKKVAAEINIRNDKKKGCSQSCKAFDPNCPGRLHVVEGAVENTKKYGERT